jgi:hypothetical protein
MPMTAGKVVCTTASGHVAIEPAHAPGHCPGAHPGEPHADREHGDGDSEPCHDVPLGGDDVVAQAKQCSPLEGGWVHALPVWMAPALGVLAMPEPVPAAPSRAASHPIAPSDMERLRTIVLLV